MSDPIDVSTQIEQLKHRQGNRIKDVALESYKGAVREIARTKAAQVMESLEISATRAVERVGGLIESPNEEIALRSSTFVIDHIIGKATQKTFSRVERVNIDVIAD